MIFTIAGALVHMPQMQSEHGLKCKSIPDIDMILWRPIPDIKTGVVTDRQTDGRMYRRTDKVVAVTLRLRFAARVN